jgi:hypothetical protein
MISETYDQWRAAFGVRECAIAVRRVAEGQQDRWCLPCNNRADAQMPSPNSA